MRNIDEIKVDKVSSRQKKVWQSRKWNAIQKEGLQKRGRSTQERIGNWNDWQRFIVVEVEPQICRCQLWKWHLHRGKDFFQLPTGKFQLDVTYAIALLKCSDDVVCA